jgi:hypothetical protein
MDTLGIAFGKLVLSGFALGIGFYLSKKLTNKIDEFILMNSKDIESLLNQQKARGINL